MTDILKNLIVTLLTPMLLTATGGDRDQARQAAIETVNAYAVSHPAELLLVGQSIALGIAMLSSVSLSMSENIPINLILRLRNNAVSLHRAAERCRSALPQPGQSEAALAPKAVAPPEPAATPAAQDDDFRAAWAAAMTDVANEMQAEMEHLPPDERHRAAQQITALNATVGQLASAAPSRRPA